MSYLGFDVLPSTHNMREAIAESFARRGVLVESPVGARVFDDHAGIPLPVRSLLWTCPDHASIVAMRTFLDARKGRAVPFWAPTCCHDLQLATSVGAGVTLSIRRAGYGDVLFATGPARQYLAIFPRGSAMLTRKVTGVAPDDPVTETVTLDATTGVALNVGSTVISFLVLCRLAEDLTEIEWHSTTHCDAKLRFVELPREVPA